MSINMNKMKEKLSKLQSKEKGGSVFWRPQDGEQTIRILPTSDGDPFSERWFHYNLGNNPGFLSPKKNFGEDDPLDQFVRRLFNEGTEDSIKMAKKLMAKQRFFSPVVVRGEEEKGVRLWGYGKMAYQELLNLVLNPDYGDITDAETGTDLVIKYGKPTGASYPQTNITPRRRSSALAEDEGKSEEWLNSIPDADKVFERKTSSEVQRMLDEWLSGESSDKEDVVKYDGTGDSSTNGTGDSSTNTTSDEIEKKFNDLLSA